MRPLIITAFISITMLSSAHSQTLNAYVKGAKEAMARKDYFSAYNFMRIAHEIEPNNLEHTYNLAEAARLYSAFTNAEKYYEEVAANAKAEEYPETNFWLAYVKQRLGKYQDALDLFQIYQTEHSKENATLDSLAEKHIATSTWAIKELEHIDTAMDLVHLGPEVNTTFSEFGAAQDSSLLYYSSLRFLGQDKQVSQPERPYAKILISKDNGEGKVDSFLNDSTLSTAHTAFNAAKDRVFYTLCDYVNGSDIRCDLYYRDIVDGHYGLAQKLPEPINMAGFTTTQPHVGYDALSGREVLYFTSDRPGGKGRLDIYYCYIVGRDNFTEPVNFEALNTPSSEVSPFYHRKSNTLYYSTEGLLGFGGLDIYSVENDNGVWGAPVDLGSPVNSSLDDAFYSLSDDEEEGYFSSNRLGSMYLSPEDEACCFDIYYFTKEPIEVSARVLTFHKLTGEPLNNCTVYLTEAGVNTETYSTGDTNEVVITVNRNSSYDVLGEKFEFTADSAKFSTSQIKESKEIVIKLYLAPAKRVIMVRTFEKRTRLPLPGVRVELVEVPGGTPRVKQEPLSTRYLFLVDPNRDVQITGTKKGYLPEKLAFNSNDNPGADTLFEDLYLEIGNLNDFLPLAIYFNNDEPGRQSKSETATVRYLETYEPYMAQRNTFIQKYSTGATAEEKEANAKAIAYFFDEDLVTGRREFESFMHILEQYLKEGLTFTIYLKGYTSPLASAAYNLSLGNRRISSIQNEFKSFSDGILWKYMESGDLVVTQKSFGEDAAPLNVSDDRKNARKSIYSPEASRERRVEIIEIQK
jgi:outer membrane protein OmpA-like peptidoglycan-associated protein